MIEILSLSDYGCRLREYIGHLLSPSDRSHEPGSSEEDQKFNLLALELFRRQFAEVPCYQAFCLDRGIRPNRVRQWQDIPALPIGAFKQLAVTSLAVEERTFMFCSSGTTCADRSRQYHDAASLGLYEASLLPWFLKHLVPEFDSQHDAKLRGGGIPSQLGSSWALQPIVLTPAPAQAPQSSLVHMLDAICQRLRDGDRHYFGTADAQGNWNLDCPGALRALREAAARDRPCLVLGTAFNLVQLVDWFADEGLLLKLPAGSRVMETGGYKGRSRSLAKTELYRLVEEFLGIPDHQIVSEYGMCELSSQAYDRGVGDWMGATPRQRRVFRFPPWCRVQVISPENGSPVREGETGLIRVFDLANVRSVLAIETEDLGIRRGDGFELVGRSVEAEPRGCSLLAVEPS